MRSPRRAREPLYLDGTPTPRDAAVFGDNWYATYLWTDFGLKFIDDARKANKPFFLYLPYNAPHFPLMAPAELIARHRGKYKAGWDRLREARYRRQIAMGLIDGRWPLSPRDPASPAWESLSDDAKDRFDHLMAVYAAMVEAIDTSVGRLVKGLEARGALDNTLILFLSDNGANAETGPDGRFDGDPPGGPNSNLYLGMNWATLGSTPFRRFKHFTHEGGIAAPLIVHWPRGIPAGRRNALVRQPAHLIDVMPTILDVTGATYPREFKGQAIQPMEGVSLRPALAGRALARTQPLFWEHEGNRAVRSGNWKLVSTYPKEWELYDMAADRVERNDLAASRPDLVRTLAAAWDAWAARANVDPWPGPPRLPWGDDAPPASAVQEVGARRTGSDVTSPEVAADRRVTFRLRAPEAKAVTVSGDFGADADMQRSDDGVWTVTVGPLDPETYVYFFTVDGVRLTDPSNPQVKIGYVTTTTTSLLTVPGDAPAFYDVQDVPHGEIRTLLYKSRVERRDPRADGLRAAGLRRRRPTAAIRCSTCCTASRTIIIPGTATAGRTTSSTTCWRSGRLQPFLVVMPLGYGGAHVNGDGTGIAPAGRRRRSGGDAGAVRARPARGHHPDDRRQVPHDRRPQAPGDRRLLDGRRAGGAFRTAAPRDVQPRRHHERRHGGGGPHDGEPIATLAADPAKTNKLIDLLWIACGTDDTAIKGARTLHQALQQGGHRAHVPRDRGRPPLAGLAALPPRPRPALVSHQVGGGVFEALPIRGIDPLSPTCAEKELRAAGWRPDGEWNYTIEPLSALTPPAQPLCQRERSSRIV